MQLAKTIVFGVLRHRQYLDFVVGRFSRHPVGKMKLRTLTALRIGVYQLLLLDRVPQSAAVNETVKAFKAGRQPAWLVRFVNGVLRNVARNKTTLPAADEATVDGEPVLNHPHWLVRRWQQYFGPEKTKDICRINNEPPLLTIRVNSTLISRRPLLALLAESGYRAEPGKFSDTALSLPQFHGNIKELPGYEEGYFVVQDEAAQLASCLLDMRENGKYLDGCAGVGGKTTHLAALLPEMGQLAAVEPEKGRYRLLGENLRRLKITGVLTENMNLAEFAAKSKQLYDGILLDAPCSGTGVIRRRPDIRWNRLADDLPACQQQQLQLLDTASSLLKKDGTIVYATCSLEPEENEQVISTFLAAHPRFFLADAGAYLSSQAACFIDVQGCFRSTPDAGPDGFFAARLCRKQ
jgi:16S rRNA (cytosine967-C5)-methyltransferase